MPCRCGRVGAGWHRVKTLLSLLLSHPLHLLPLVPVQPGHTLGSPELCSCWGEGVMKSCTWPEWHNLSEDLSILYL